MLQRDRVFTAIRFLGSAEVCLLLIDLLEVQCLSDSNHG